MWLEGGVGVQEENGLVQVSGPYGWGTFALLILAMVWILNICPL